MKINIRPLLFSLLFMSFACSEDSSEPGSGPGGQEEPENPYKTGTDLSSSTFDPWEKKGMDDSFFMLGYGYDVTGKYAHPSSVRNQVIDVEEYDKDDGSVVFIQGSSSGPEAGISGSLRECVNTMGERAGFKAGEISKYKNLFKGTFASPFKNDSSFPDLSYNYRGISQVHALYHLSFLYSSYMRERIISKYLTDAFKTDIETKTGEEIIRLYGTHILKNIKIGERIDYLYRYAGDENSNSGEWFLYNMHRYFSQGPSAWGSEPDKDPPLKENLYIDVVDGTLPDPNAWMVDITNYAGERILFEGWKDISDANLTFVAFRSNDCLVPIHEFVKDPAKKEELIKAYEKYLGE